MVFNKFNRIKDKIYPWVKQSLGEEYSSDIELDMPFKHLIADLVVVFVVDKGDRYEVLQQEQIPAHVTVDDLYALAIQNLQNNIRFELVPADFGGYGILAGGDHEAGALCLDHLWEFCAGQIGEDLIVAVPSKDVVFMVGESQTEALREMRKVASDIIKGGDRTLTEHIFLYDRKLKRFSIYE